MPYTVKGITDNSKLRFTFMYQYKTLLRIVQACLFISFSNGYSSEEQSNDLRDTLSIPQTKLIPEINGKLDEKAWEYAVVIDSFYQYTPQNGVIPTERTVAYLMYDQENLYFGIRCYDSTPDRIRATLSPRNQWQNNDNAFIYLDTYDNQRDNFLFMINPLGVQKNSFETIWFSDGTIDSLGWSGEIAIPFKSLRFPDMINQSWGIVIGRNIYHKGENLNSVDCGYNENFYTKFTKAIGIKNISDGHNIEILPYGAMRYSEGQFYSEKDGAVGFDAKYGVGTNLILEGSFAPDFSQIESDPFFVNFSPYEYQLTENRQFFNEGVQYFALPNPLFYTRRIESPKMMGKLTGKEGPWNIGVITAWDTPKSSDDKMTYALRLQKDVLKTSKIGMMMSGFETKRKDYNRNLSIDGQFSQGGEHHFQFQLASTYNSGISNDENFLIYLNHQIRKIDGINYSLTYLDVGPNYNPQTGIVGKTGYRNPKIFLGYKWHLPDWGVESLTVSTQGDYSVAYGGMKVGSSAGATFSVSTISKLMASFQISKGEERSQLFHQDQFVWNNKIFPSSYFNLSFSSITGSIFDANISYLENRHALYLDDFTKQQKGVDKSFNLGLTIKPTSNILINNSAGFYQQKLNGEARTFYETLLLNNSINYQITRNIFSRIIQRLDTKEKSQQIDFLIGYEFFAGSTFYVSYKELRNYNDEVLKRDHYMIFCKMSYLFRI